MKANFIFKSLIIFLFFSNYLDAQNYIKAVCKLNSGEILEGMIKNDFQNEDAFLSFKVNNEDTKISLVNINELIINDNEKYLSRLVEFHPNRIKSKVLITNSSFVDLKERISKHVLLKVLLEGEANLFQSFVNGVSIYFYSKSEYNNFTYLEYFDYVNKDLIFSSNDLYKRQLLLNFNCNQYLNDKFQYIKYSQEDLVGVIDQYNKCFNGYSKNLVTKRKKIFRYSFFGGLKLINARFDSETLGFKTKLSDNSSVPNFGFEFSHVIPNRKENFEIFSRIDFSSLKLDIFQLSKVPFGITEFEEKIYFDSSIFCFSIGSRYNINSLNDLKKGNLGFDFSVNSSIPLNTNFIYSKKGTNGQDDRFDLSKTLNKVAFNVCIGTSYTYMKKYTFEIRYNTNSNFVEKTIVNANFSNLNIGFKYLIFQNKNNK